MAPELLFYGCSWKETLMRNAAFNTIQMIEELVDKVFRKHHLAVPDPPPTVRFKVVEEFTRMKDLFKVA